MLLGRHATHSPPKPTNQPNQRTKTKNPACQTKTDIFFQMDPEAITKDNAMCACRHFRQMESYAANIITADLTDANGAVLKTREVKGSALLQRFVQQCSQNNLDERKAVWKKLNRTLTEAGSNDDPLTELEITTALSELLVQTRSNTQTSRTCQ